MFCTMELVDGESLTSRLGQRRRLPVAEAVPIAIAMCAALERLAHRDRDRHRLGDRQRRRCPSREVSDSPSMSSIVSTSRRRRAELERARDV